MTNLEIINFGVVGVGRIGKIHIENLCHRLPGTGVNAVADVVKEDLQNVAKKFDIPYITQDYREILSNPAIDAIVICSPTNTHARIIEEAAANGKHVFCEKPIDLTLDKIKRVIEVVEQTDIKFQVGFNRRYDPNFLKVYHTVKSGKIGKPQILKITSRDPSPPPLSYLQVSGGMFLDMTIHDFDMARYLMQKEVIEVFTVGKVLVDPIFDEANDVDTAITVLTFENGGMATIDNSRQAVYGYDQRVEVFGSDGMVMVNNNTPDNHLYFNKDSTHSALPLNFFMDRYTDSYLNEMDVFINCIKNDESPDASGKDGLIAVAIGLAAKKSLEKNRPVQLSEIIKL